MNRSSFAKTREGTIHRFEITIELMWKTLKRALEYEGVGPKTPRESLKEAFVSASFMMKIFGLICSITGIRRHTFILPKNSRKITTTKLLR
ncbi:nucleotidyltransferase substrate binding protein [Bradyrhizobium sp. BRP14]|nr:nucleotidyltransferase substrate binding protein [Bradyrhizobium sp. BRP14]